MKQIIKLIKQYKYELFALLLICVYIAYFTFASFLKYDNFYTGRFDLGNMAQTVWNTLHERIFQSGNADGLPTLRLSGHADFLLILLAPFYVVWENPKMLLLIQTVVLGLGGIFVYLLAKDIIKNKKIALTLTASYLLYPQLQFANLFDFHAVTLATTFFLGAFYFLQKNKILWFFIFLLLACLTKEQIWLISALFGGFIAMIRPKNRLAGLVLFFGSLAIFYFLLWHAIPNTLGKQHFALAYYSEFGNSPSDVIKNVLSSPAKILNLVFQQNRFEFLYQLLMPLGFFSLLAPLLLIFSLPDLSINLLSSNSQLHQIYYHYTAAITPFVFIAGIFGIKKFCKWFPKIPPIVITGYLLAFALLSAYNFGPLPGAKQANTAMFVHPQQNREIIDQFISRIPESAILATTNNLGSHLSHRQRITIVPAGMDTADFVLFLFAQTAAPALQEQKEMAEKIENDNNYKKVFEKDNFLVFKRG